MVALIWVGLVGWWLVEWALFWPFFFCTGFGLGWAFSLRAGPELLTLDDLNWVSC